MFNKNDDCMIRIMQYLREHSSDDLTSVNIFINCEGMTITTKHKSADDLKIMGCSMKNIKGEWIKDKEIKVGIGGDIID